jgi:glycerol-3-phosphate dehydrogenase
VERLVLEMVLDARAHGAVCLNHAAVKRIVVDESGGRHAAGVDVDVDGQRIRLRAGAVVNATGCWVDETLGELAAGQPPKVRKTKGAHVVVPRFVDVALIVKAASDGRTFFILPWGPHCVIGTTDTDYAGDAGDAVADEADVRYLLDEARHYFPQAPLDRVEYTYAGVRALVNEQGVTESNVTRRHILYDHGERDGVAGLWTLQGGKITTARTLGEECVDRVCAYLGRRDAAKDRPTRKAPLPGCPAEDWEPYRTKAIAQAAARGLDAGSAAHLVDAYGARLPHVLDHDPQGATRIHPAHPHLVAEIGWAVVHEDARTLGDVLLRRTDLGLAVDGAPVVARRVADRMAALLGWDAGEQARQWEAYVAEARHFAVPQAVDVPR